MKKYYLEGNLRHKVLAVFICIGLFLSISAFISFAEFKYLSRPSFIMSSLEKGGVYKNLPQISDAFLSQAQANLETRVMVTLVARSIDPKDLKAQIDKNLPILKTLSSKKPSEVAVFDLVSFKNNFKRNLTVELPNIVKDEVAQMPSCQGQTQAKNGLPDCKPSSVSQKDFENELVRALTTEDFLKSLPDEFKIGPDNNFLSNPHTIFSIFNIGLIFSFLVSLLFIYILTMLGKPQWDTVARWVGIALLAPGITSLAVALLSLSFANFAIIQVSEGLSSEILAVSQPVINALLKNSLPANFFFSGIFFFSGLFLLILSFFISHRKSLKVQNVPQLFQ